MALLQAIERALTDDDWARATDLVQRWKYEVENGAFPDAEKAAFATLMQAFARCSPVYQTAIKALWSQVREQPGILQSALLKDMPGDQKEAVRAALYRAEALGDIIREKKGRSYQLFPPQAEQPLPASPAAWLDAVRQSAPAQAAAAELENHRNLRKLAEEIDALGVNS